MKTIINAGRVFAAFVEDGQGRRLVLGEMKLGAAASMLTVAVNQLEARAVVDALRNMIGDLPGNGAP
jgi:hypothetical protein